MNSEGAQPGDASRRGRGARRTRGDGQTEAQRRDAELSSGSVAGRTHGQVMETMRRACRQDISGGFPSNIGGIISSPSMQILNTENNSLSSRY